MTDVYTADSFGKEEAELVRRFKLQRDDAKNYFLQVIKPRLDRSYKLYIAYNGDRAKEISSWQANIFVPYVQSVVETLMPRVLDARPEFSVQGRTEEDQIGATKIQQLGDYSWEKAGMDTTNESLVRSSLVYGTGYLQASWKKDVRTQHFLETKDLLKKKYVWKEKEKVFYDAPYAEWIDNYSLWYDWHNVSGPSKQFWFKRLVLCGAEIKRRYPMYDKKRLAMAFAAGSGDIQDYGSIRNEVKKTHEKINKGSDFNASGGGITTTIYQNNDDPDFKMFEVFEWTMPFEDTYSVLVCDVPILKGGFMPILYDFKEAPFIDFPYLRVPGEFEGYGLPMILENPQIMLNTIKNQRLDAATLNIHKMWIVNPLANIDKKDLVTRPFGIIYSPDPNGVKPVEFSDLKSSAYKEEDLLKSDMRYASGVDDFSMGVGGQAGSATEVRHLRESTLERVRLFVNHLGEGYAKLLRYWISMYRQFFTNDMIIRIIGDDGMESYPLIQKDDLMGEFDYKSSVLPSIAGKNDIDKKQGMDLFQLLISLPFVDPRKLTSKVLHSWNWNLDSIAKSENEEVPPEVPGVVPEGELSPEMLGMAGAPQEDEAGANGLPNLGSGEIPPDIIQQAISMLGGSPPQGSPFVEAGAPINLLGSGALPPTAPSIPMATSNPRGFNRGGKVNTNIPLRDNSSTEANLMNKVNNIQR
jgi:hypothetical protein